MTTFWCEHAWLPYGPAQRVQIEVVAERISTVSPDAPASGTILAGLTIPGAANSHSHAFHRALRGRTNDGCGSFWTWRERMYALAGRLDPESYYRMARAVYGEMMLAGFTSVGEFHYLHHAPSGKPYAEPNAMGEALIEAAHDAGIRLTLLDTCYLAGGFGQPPNEIQRRFSDGDAEHWAERVTAIRPGPARIGAAIHSVRAVPEQALPVPALWAAQRNAPLHMHVSEQRKENAGCIDHCGRTPIGLLADSGALGPQSVAVHATHLSVADVGLLARWSSAVCFCPTTERDLGDGIGCAARLRDAGIRLCLGSDSHAVIDPFEEMRALELDERLATRQRGHFSVAELLDAATDHAAIGWPEVGRIEPGRAADLVVLDTASSRTAGVPADGVPFVASSADVRTVIVGGRRLVDGGHHERLGEVRTLLDKEIRRLWE